MIPHSIRRILALDPIQPVTQQDVASAPRDHNKEDMIRKARGKLAKEVVDLERAAWEVRRELAENVVSIVSGEYRNAKGTHS